MSTHDDKMRDAEAREWIQRVRKEGHTRADGNKRLLEILGDIAKRRGKAAAADLKARVERELGRELQ
ncbi:hypothetical protein [Ottowia sp. VDI28]|uniref:hypothetical protein n=1 Tax=Ottowia sp. VDI28 TaxID=3133968 RepID=UPI003C2D3674